MRHARRIGVVRLLSLSLVSLLSLLVKSPPLFAAFGELPQLRRDLQFLCITPTVRSASGGAVHILTGRRHELICAPCGSRQTSVLAVTGSAVEDASMDTVPLVGRRMRVWFTQDQEEDRPDYEYCTVLSVHGPPGPEQEIVVEWDSEGKEKFVLADMGRIEWLGDDWAADLAANLKEHRQGSLEGALEGNAEAVVLDLDQLRKESKALAWLREELTTRAAEMKALRQENEELRAQREEYLARRGDLLANSSHALSSGDANMSAIKDK